MQWREAVGTIARSRSALTPSSLSSSARASLPQEDVDVYASVPMHEVANIECEVLNVYGLVGGGSQASYDVGDAMLTDGVVPFSDVEPPANLIRPVLCVGPNAVY